jgi:lupus La protein
MSDAAIKDQPGVAVAATEAQPVAETTPAVATVDESEKEADAVPEAQNGDEKKSTDVLKTTARIDHKDHKKNRKYDPSTQPVTDDPIKIRGQVCYPHRKPSSHPNP